MVVEYVLGLVVTFLLVVAGSYIGAKMALNTFFGRDFDPSETNAVGQSAARSDEED